MHAQRLLPGVWLECAFLRAERTLLLSRALLAPFARARNGATCGRRTQRKYSALQEAMEMFNLESEVLCFLRLVLPAARATAHLRRTPREHRHDTVVNIVAASLYIV
jgi:hypothetical protein